MLPSRPRHLPYGILSAIVIFGFLLLLVWIVGGDLGFWENPGGLGLGIVLLAFVVSPALLLLFFLLVKWAGRESKPNLFAVIDKVDLPRLSALLDKRPDLVNLKDKDGCPALVHAVERSGNNGTLAASLLIKRGADLNARDKWGTTSLYKAAENGNAALVLLLLDKGADPSIGLAADYYLHPAGETPLGVAQRRGHAAVAEHLLRHPRSGG